MTARTWKTLAGIGFIAILGFGLTVYFFGREQFDAAYSQSFREAVVKSFGPACIEAGTRSGVSLEKQTAFCGCVAVYVASLPQPELEKMTRDQQLLTSAPQFQTCEAHRR